ncbi:putative glycosyltransferase involved in capsule biosynthesis [Salibacterium salarium]|uniref:galactosyltransferase-related protein n=1 Tax=Salibacterium salarium TaxID=284579 RepID=UPI0027864E5F|nr:galactosyltransferase-related protein [Salibacterium salarium]MDQ0300702.1 putative glycosyltransferase involved in capsule biosynthesis [Salibacterium salarium]
MITTSIIIPFETDNGPRDKAFHWLKTYYKNVIANAEICIGTSQSKPFSKSKAINNAAQKAKGSIFVLIDADIICHPVLISKSIHLLKKHTWIIPYSRVKNITTGSTTKLLNTKPVWPLQTTVKTEKMHEEKKLPVGGINIMPKECFRKVRGFDERFAGWGGEDDAFACSVDTLCGPHHRLDTSIYHLWHPKSIVQKSLHYKRNVQLAYKYCEAYGNKRTMQQIIQSRNK